MNRPEPQVLRGRDREANVELRRKADDPCVVDLHDPLVLSVGDDLGAVAEAQGQRATDGGGDSEAKGAIGTRHEGSFPPYRAGPVPCC